MDYRLTPEQEALQKEFNDFFRDEMKNAPTQWDASIDAMYGSDVCWEFHKQMARTLGTRGWLSRAWPREYGGLDAPLIGQFIVSEEMGYHRAAGVDMLGVNVLAPTLIVSGNEEQKKQHLPPTARGERFWCQCWSEPNAGSDLASLTTRAVRDGDDYIINGKKIWTTGAHRADWCNILVRKNPNEKRSRGLSFFLLYMQTPGITAKPVLHLEGSHSFNEIFLDNVRVPARNMVGEENQGWLASQLISNFARPLLFFFAASQSD